MKAENPKPLKSRLPSLIPALFCLTSMVAQPPGATVSVKLDVDPSLRTGVFATDRYLNVPPGFKISLLAQVSGARFLAVAPDGNILVSNPGAGKVYLLTFLRNGTTISTYVSGLRRPHDIVFHAIDGVTYVYISESNQINRFKYNLGDTTAHDREILITGLPDSSTPELKGAYAHELKNLALGPDHKLYVSVASSCNVCTSDPTSDPVRGAIYQYNADGTGGRLFARGLRNAEGLAFLPGTNTLWAVVNNRDDIAYPAQDSTGNYGRVMQSYVDNHPPDLFTSVRDGGNYGWPFCNSNPDAGYGNMPFDRDYQMNRDGHVDCASMDTVARGIQAHSAPLGMLFLQNTAAPSVFRNGAVVALHGSWNRAKKTGYKVVYFPWESSTQTPGDQIDLVSGWLNDNTQVEWGRPVDVAVDLQGNLLISDDTAGAIYKLASSQTAVSSASGYGVIAPDSLASIFGASFPGGDINLTIGGKVAKVIYASATQINFLVPTDVPPGSAVITLQGNTLSNATVATVAPGLFTANGNGSGVAAATAIRQVIPTKIQSDVPVFTCATPGNCTPAPINVGVDAPVYLSFYGTGIRNFSSLSNVSVTIGGVAVPVLYAGPQNTYPGLDQVNVPLPLSLRGKGEVDVILTVDGVASNAVRIAIQ
jgi:uncharacterized protein (TIGR03437 family)